MISLSFVSNTPPRVYYTKHHNSNSGGVACCCTQGVRHSCEENLPCVEVVNMRSFLLVCAFVLALFLLGKAQDYEDYSRGYSGSKKGKGGMLMPIGTFLAGCLVGRWNSKRGSRKKWEQEKKELTQYMRMQVDKICLLKDLLPPYFMNCN